MLTMRAHHPRSGPLRAIGWILNSYLNLTHLINTWQQTTQTRSMAKSCT
jgi:hypothetical protein